MRQTNIYLQRLEQAEAQLGHDALAKPTERTEFEYGRVCGIKFGLTLAKAIVNAILDEEEGKEKSL